MTTEDKAQAKVVTPESYIFIPKALPGDWQPKPLTIAGSLQLTRLIGWLLVNTATNLRAVDVKNIRQEDILNIFSAIEPEVVQEIFAVVLHQTPAWVETHWSLSKAVKCFGEFWELEDLSELFLAAANLMNKRIGQNGTTG